MKNLLTLLTLLTLFSNSLFSANFYISPSVLEPNNGCILSNSESVKIIIGNAEVTPVASTTFEISYTVNGTTVTETYTTPPVWAGSATISYTFSTNADLSDCQEHVFEFSLDLPGDTDSSNNTLTYSVFSDCNPTVGSIDGPTNVCEGINSDDLTLSGYNGIINKWQSSNNSGASWNDIPNTGNIESFVNLTQETAYKVILDSPFGLCPSDTTDEFTIAITPLSDGGDLKPNQNICSNGNNGLLDLSGQTGDILNWEFSVNGGISWNTLNLINDTLLFNDVFTTTQYRVVVQNGNCPSTLSNIAELTVIAGSDAGYIAGEDTVCNAEADSLLSVTGFYGNIQSWIYSSDSGATWINTQDNNTSFSYASLLGYTIFGAVIQEGNCPADTAFHPIVVLPTSVSGGPNQTIFEGDSVQLFGSGGISHVWIPATNIDNETSQNPTVWPETDVTYSVEVTDIYNCKDTAFVFVQVNPDLQNVIIPNLLTPNGDGYNDTWEITNIETYNESEVHIFDAYGKIIYQASPYLNDWQATFNDNTLPDGTYFYIIQLNNEIAPIKGTLTIVSKQQ